MNDQRIKSALELAKYKVGQTLYWVVLRPVGSDGVQIPPGEEWAADCHPKTLHERGYVKTWKYKQKLPRLQSLDFQYVVDLLTNEPVVEEFEITTVHRSLDTGEFYYANPENEWMPQGSLFATAAAAKKEKLRIKDLFKTWANRISPDEV